MNRVTVAVMLALGVAGCASSGAIRQGAYEHLAKAQALEAQGDYERAAKERDTGQRQLRKADVRAYDEAELGAYRYYR